MNEAKSKTSCVAALAFAAQSFLCCSQAGAAQVQNDYFRPGISYEDGCETFAGPARGYAPGGWTAFKPEGLPKWHGAKAYNSSLWDLSRFSGGREQGGKRPPDDRVGKADVPLTDAMKADVRRFLDETRANGGSLIVRIGYTWSDSPGCEPSDFDVILGHVRDLSQIMSDYDDVVVAVEAGVAGPWGEMHTSDYCKPQYMNRVLKTYCDNLAERTSVLVRAPHYISSYIGTNAVGTLGKLPFRDRCLRRFGMYNDGYLGTWWDYGTWAGEWRRERGTKMLSSFGDHPYGGELAYVNSEWLEKNREKCADLFDVGKWNIVKDWYDCHLNYLRNVGDRKHPLCKFIAGKAFRVDEFRFEGMPELKEYDGADLHKFMLDHMGYRFVVRNARLPKALRRGKKAMLALEVENTGFGKLLLQSRVEVMLRVNGTLKACDTDQPENGLSSIGGGARLRMPVSFAVPPGVPPRGNCELCVRVSCPVKGEQPGAAPRRLVRFANGGMWVDQDGVNTFGTVELRP